MQFAPDTGTGWAAGKEEVRMGFMGGFWGGAPPPPGLPPPGPPPPGPPTPFLYQMFPFLAPPPPPRPAPAPGPRSALGTALGWPLDTNVISSHNKRGQISNVWGDVPGRSGWHKGWDLYAPIGTVCYAVADGRVRVAADWERQYGHLKGRRRPGSTAWKYGKVIELEFICPPDHPRYGGQPLRAFYAHLSQIGVGAGQMVRLGQPIGNTGASGNASASAPHVHFEFRAGRDINPSWVLLSPPPFAPVVRLVPGARRPPAPPPPPSFGPPPMAMVGPFGY